MLVGGIGALGGAVSVGAAAGAGAAAAGGDAATTTTTSPWVPGTGGTLTVGIDQAPTGCNPNTASGDTWADRLLLEPVLPSAFTIDSSGQPVYNSALITQAELQGTNPETVVYTINPSAVWSDGTPVTAADFIYTWEEERGTGGPVGTAPTAPAAASTPAATPAAVTTPKLATSLPGATGTTGPTVGYRQIASVTSGAHGRTVTVVFKTPYQDWQSLFDDLLPAHVLERTGWDPQCTSLDPSIDLSAGPYLLDDVVPGKEVVLARNPKWWGQVPPLDRIVVRIASGSAQLSQWLASGAIDVALPSGYHEHFLEAVTSQPSVISQSELSTTFLQLEFSTTSPLTSTTDARLAIAHAIDRQSLVDEVVGWADSTVVPAASHLYAEDEQGYPAHKPPPLQVSGQPSSTTTTTTTGPAAGTATAKATAAAKTTTTTTTGPAAGTATGKVTAKATGTGTGNASGTSSTSPTSTTATPFPPDADLALSTSLFIRAGVFRIGTAPRKLLTGKPYVLHLAVDDADAWASQAATVLVSQLRADGIEVRVVDATSAQAAGLDLAAHDADMALIPMHSSPYPSQAIAWYTPLLGTPGTDGSQDWSDFDDPNVNTLLEQASQQLNPVDAGPIYSQVDSVLWQQMVALPLFTQPSVLAWSGLAAGVSPNANGASLLWDTQSWAIRVPPTSPEAKA